VLYNGFLSSVGTDGKTFFYQNRLAANGDYRRRPWYSCACCPSNIVRVFPKLGRYAYASDEKSLYVNLYAAGSGKVAVGDTPITLTQLTRYPWDGNVKLMIHPAAEKSFELCLRVPGWCREAKTPGGLYEAANWDANAAAVQLKVNGQPVDDVPLDRGYLRISRVFKPGDLVELGLPMPIRRIHADERVKADAGRVALQRGPIVYCVESAGHRVDLGRLILPVDAKLAAEHRPDLLGGVTVITGQAVAATDELGKDEPARLLAVPYYAWDNRGAGKMAVWMAEERPATRD